MTERLRRALWALRHPIRVWGPRCAAPAPWRLPDARPCCRPRRHTRARYPGADWHADGHGYIWNATRWGWRGPTVNVADLHEPATATHALFTEQPQEPTP